jgi:AcrR family transcriptional regulator
LVEGLRKRQKRAAATSEQLLIAAREVFQTHGFQGTTVGAITDRAATAHGTFYLYFRNKEDAFAKVMAQVTEEMYQEAAVSWAGDLRTTVARAIGGFLTVFRAHRGLWQCLLEGMHTSAAVERMWLDLRRPFIVRVQRLLDYLVADGSIRSMHTGVTAHAMAAMVEWFAFTHFELDEPSADDVDFEQVVETLTDLWVQAIFSGATLST